MNSSPSDGIESELRDLRSRLLRIEEALRSRGVALEEPAPPPAAQPGEAPVPTLPARPVEPVAEPRAIATPVRLSEPPPYRTTTRWRAGLDRSGSIASGFWQS